MIRWIQQLIHYYSHDMKLHKKLLLSHALLVLLPSIVLVFFLYSQLSTVIINNTISSEQMIAKQTRETIESILTNATTVSHTLSNHTFFRSLLSDYDDTNELAMNTITEDAIRCLVDATFSINQLTVPDIKIYLDERFDALLKNENLQVYSILQPMSKIRGSYWHGIFQSTPTRSLLCPSLYLTPGEQEQYGNMSYVQKIPFNASTKQPAAYIVIYLSQPKINAILSNEKSVADSVTYMINERDALVATSDINSSGKYLLNYQTISKVLPTTSTFQKLSFAEERAYVAYQPLTNTDWYLVSVLPINSVMNKSESILRQFILAYIIIVILAMFLSLRISHSIVKRISSIIHQMKLVRNGKPEPLLMPQEHDEIGDLIDTYNYMTTELSTLMEREATAASELRIAEFKALQSQINPHFLYNTLDMINWLSLSGKSNEVCAAVQALSRFYKLTLSKGSNIVTIEEELEHVSLYMTLQNMRYQNRILFLIDVPDDILHYTIPKLIFQPLVENSIQHGILGKESKSGTIVITGWLDGDYLVLLISDDGIGLSESTLEVILTKDGISTSGSHFGVFNTHQRLQLFYGNECGLSYESDGHSETIVTIRIPAQ